MTHWTWNPDATTEVVAPTPARWIDHAPTVTGPTPVSAETVRLPAVPAVRRPRRRMSRWHWLWLAPAVIAAPLAGMFVAAVIDLLMHGGA